MILKHYNPQIPIPGSSIAWRYMSLQKLIDILEGNEIYFARLDTFDDPLEGLPFDVRCTIDLIRTAQNKTALPEFKTHFQSQKIPREIIRRWQLGSFASCWYLTESKNTESLVMWDLYTDKNCLAFSIPFATLKRIISESLKKYDDGEIVESLYGKIEYLEEYDHAMKVSPSLAPSFIKSPIYSHENELRFMLFRKNALNQDRKGIKLKLLNPLSSLSSEIIIYTHPDMENSVSQLIITKIESHGFVVLPSNILTKNNINGFIRD